MAQPRAKPRLRKAKPNHFSKTAFSPLLANVYQVVHYPKECTCRNPKSAFYTRANRFIEKFCFVGYYAAFSSCLIFCLENYFTHSISVGTHLAVDTERIKVQLLVESSTPSLRCMLHAACSLCSLDQGGWSAWFVQCPRHATALIDPLVINGKLLAKEIMTPFTQHE